MCSVQDEDGPVPQKRANDFIPGRRTCMKCDNAAVVLIRMDDPLCRACFVQYTTHKFRAAFGKARIIRDKELVLVAFSGGSSSSAMVHLIQEGLSKRAQKKLRFSPTLVYIDEGSVMGLSTEERCQANTMVMGRMRELGVSHIACALEQVMAESGSPAGTGSGATSQAASCSDTADPTSSLEKLTLNDSYTEQLNDLLGAAKTLTARQALVQSLRQRLLVLLARERGINKVLVADSATRLSVRLLSNMTQGKGAHLPYEMSFADKRHGDVIFVRPMREFTAKEVAMYNSMNNIHPIFISTLSTKVPAHASLDRLTEDFIAGLQAQYPNTTSTVLRTGEKLGLGDTDVDNCARCCLCQCPLDTDVGTSSALAAKEFSQALCVEMAQKQCSHDDAAVSANCGPGVGQATCSSTNTKSCDQTCGGEFDGSCRTKTQVLGKEEMVPFLCYGCRLVVNDMESVSSLPRDISDEVCRQMRRKEMEASVKDYLLSDGPDKS